MNRTATYMGARLYGGLPYGGISWLHSTLLLFCFCSIPLPLFCILPPLDTVTLHLPQYLPFLRPTFCRHCHAPGYRCLGGYRFSAWRIPMGSARFCIYLQIYSHLMHFLEFLPACAFPPACLFLFSARYWVFWEDACLYGWVGGVPGVDADTWSGTILLPFYVDYRFCSLLCR